MSKLSGKANLTIFVIAFLNGIHLLTLLHSKGPKLYTVLAFLSAKGLKERFASLGANIFPFRVDLHQERHGPPLQKRKSQKLFTFA